MRIDNSPGGGLGAIGGLLGGIGGGNAAAASPLAKLQTVKQLVQGRN